MMSKRALLGSWPKLLDRRSFLIGSAARLSGLGLAGCASLQRDKDLAEAQGALRAGATGEIPDPG